MFVFQQQESAGVSEAEAAANVEESTIAEKVEAENDNLKAPVESETKNDVEPSDEAVKVETLDVKEAESSGDQNIQDVSVEEKEKQESPKKGKLAGLRNFFRGLLAFQFF